MKRVGNIYANMYDKNNIRQAILKAAAGKRNRKKVTKIIENIDFYINDIYQMLISKDVKLSPYKKMKIHDGARKKERIIYKPAFYPDQCIHWCVMIQLQPLLEKGMYEYCCASVPKRGIHYGSKYLKRILKDDKKKHKVLSKIRCKEILSKY